MRKLVLFFFAFSISHSVWALPDKELVQSCWVPAAEKLMEKAGRKDCEIQISQMQVEALDNRWYNPSKYVWFSCPAVCEEGTTKMEVLVQYFRGHCE